MIKQFLQKIGLLKKSIIKLSPLEYDRLIDKKTSKIREFIKMQNIGRDNDVEYDKNLSDAFIHYEHIIKVGLCMDIKNYQNKLNILNHLKLSPIQSMINDRKNINAIKTNSSNRLLRYIKRKYFNRLLRFIINVKLTIFSNYEYRKQQNKIIKIQKLLPYCGKNTKDIATNILNSIEIVKKMDKLDQDEIKNSKYRKY